MNKFLLPLVFSIVLLSGALSQNAFATEPPPKIKFVNVDAMGCKIFEITDKNKLAFITELQVGKITELNVFVREGDGTQMFSVSQPVTTADPDGPTFWTWEFDQVTNPATKPRLKACPGGDEFSFVITAEDQKARISDKNPARSRLLVFEKEIEAGKDGKVSGTFKLTTFKSCDKIKKQMKENLRLTNAENFDPDCKKIDKNRREITISGNLPAGSTDPGLITSAFDPHQVFNVMQLAICVINLNTGNLICPTNVPVNLIFTFASHPIGGTILPLDTTALLLAGVQTNLAWVVPVALSAAGIGVGIYLVKRRS